MLYEENQTADYLTPCEILADEIFCLFTFLVDIFTIILEKLLSSREDTELQEKNAERCCVYQVQSTKAFVLLQ